jgi:hypothetical protein
MPTQRLALVMHTSVAVDDLLGITIMQLVHQAIDAGGRPVRLNALAPSDFDGAPVPPRLAAPIATNGDQLQHRDTSRLGVRCHEDCPARRALTRAPTPIRRRTAALWTSCWLGGVGRHGRCDRPRHHHDGSALRGCRLTAANVLQTFWATAANVLQTPDRRKPAKPGETTYAIPRVFGVSCPCSLRFAEHEPIGEKGSGWLCQAIFAASAVVLRSLFRERVRHRVRAYGGRMYRVRVALRAQHLGLGGPRTRPPTECLGRAALPPEPSAATHADA